MEEGFNSAMADQIDLRVKIDLDIKNWLDAHCISSGREIGEVVREKLGKLAKEDLHFANVLTRIAQPKGK
jgi:hypothetical protein